MKHALVFTPRGQEGPTKVLGPFDDREAAVKYLQSIGAVGSADHRIPDSIWYRDEHAAPDLDDDGCWDAYEIVPMEAP